MRYIGMTQKISSAMQTTQNPPRIPVDHNGIQYNSCKNPKCSQFGVHILDTRGKGEAAGAYRVVAAAKGYPLLNAMLVAKCHR